MSKQEIAIYKESIFKTLVVLFCLGCFPNSVNATDFTLTSFSSPMLHELADTAYISQVGFGSLGCENYLFSVKVGHWTLQAEKIVFDSSKFRYGLKWKSDAGYIWLYDKRIVEKRIGQLVKRFCEVHYIHPKALRCGLDPSPREYDSIEYSQIGTGLGQLSVQEHLRFTLEKVSIGDSPLYAVNLYLPWALHLPDSLDIRHIKNQVCGIKGFDNNSPKIKWVLLSGQDAVAGGVCEN